MVRSAAAILAVLILPSFAQAQQPQRTHTVVRGNTLWDLAQTFYQDPFEWRVIWEANRGVVEDPNWIYPDEVLVIPGLPARADRTPAPAAQPTTPQPAAPRAPAAGQVPSDLIPFGFRQARPADEVRTIFYRDTSQAGSRVVRTESAMRVAVAADAVYSSPWLIGLEEAPESSGVIEGFADREERATTIRSFQRVRVAMPSPARVGATLQIFRVTRTIESVGQVVVPSGLLEVTTIGNGFVVGTVTKEYARVQPGDLVRPLPPYTPRPGVQAAEVSGGPEAMIMGFAGTQVINELGYVAFLDLGSVDGIAIGDEFVLFGQEVPTAREGALQVVSVSETTASARITALTDDVFRQGIVVRLVRKMP